MKTVLVTGVTGFLGRYTAAHYQSLGWQVCGIGTRAEENAPPGLARYTRMELPSTDLDDLVAKLAPEVCVHCAGRASVELSMTDPSADFRAGVDAVFNVLDALRRHSPRCRVVFLSSAAVYGNPGRLPIAESDTPRPISPYGFHKLIGEQLCLEFHRVYGLPTSAARVFSAYGPGLRRQVIWDVCRRALTEPVLTLRGTGEESRDFIHARDVAAALVLIGERADCQGEAYNIASGSETKMAALSETILGKTGRLIPVEFDGVVHAGVPRNWRADVDKLMKIGFKPEIELDHGLETYAQWCHAEVFGQ